jgi:2-dehydropantoate 2-reductase
MDINRVSLIGLGALGVLFAHQLSQKLPRGDLRIIADSNRIRRYRRDGITINGESVDFNYVTPEQPADPADLLLIAVKFNDLDDAVKAVRNHVGPETIILSILNGISSEEIIGRTYGMDKLLLCVAQGMDATKLGNALTVHSKGFLFFGDAQPGVRSEKTNAVDRFLTRMGIAHEIPPDMKKHQWSKFMLNCGCNETTAVYRCDYAGIQKGGKYRQTMLGAMEEVLALAEREGVALTRDDLGYWETVLAGLNPKGKTSMQQDVEAKRPSEIEMLGGTVLELAAKHGMPVPVNKMLYDALKEIELTY